MSLLCRHWNNIAKRGLTFDYISTKQVVNRLPGSINIQSGIILYFQILQCNFAGSDLLHQFVINSKVISVHAHVVTLLHF